MPIFHTHVSTAVDISGNLLMLPCYLFVHKCNVKEMMTMCVEASCKIVVFTEWRIYIKSSASIAISLSASVVLENIENWLGGYKRWLCSVLNCKNVHAWIVDCPRINFRYSKTIFFFIYLKNIQSVKLFDKVYKAIKRLEDFNPGPLNL